MLASTRCEQTESTINTSSAVLLPGSPHAGSKSKACHTNRACHYEKQDKDRTQKKRVITVKCYYTKADAADE